MLSSSCINLFDLTSGNIFNMHQTFRSLPMVVTTPGIISDPGDENIAEELDVPSPEPRKKTIIVANFLPLCARKDLKTGRWLFNLDEDSILLQLRDGVSPDFDVFYVGSLKVDVDASEQEEVALELQEKYNCVPTFLPSDLHEKYYHGFCKQYLWPIFHYMLPMCPEFCNHFDQDYWKAYVSANKIFADRVMEVLNADDDYVWVHDYHLMVLPTILRRRFHRVKLGFFLHSPFPSSEIYRTLPVREEILKTLLNADLIGFHTFDYARHFLSCCSRILGLNYESKRGYIGLDYFGRTVYVKILPVGIHVGCVESALNHPSSSIMASEIQQQFGDKKLIVGVDDMDIFKGISLKLLAMERLLEHNPDMQGQVVLVQIVNPARSRGKDVQEAQRETYLTTERINEKFGLPGYKPIILIERPLQFFEKTAYYASADCCIVNAVRDGMNLIPYKYIVCRQGTPAMDQALQLDADSLHTSVLVVSEFIGCSPSLSGAIRVNPWDVDAVANALYQSLEMPPTEKQLRHEKHYRYVASHDVAYWARSFLQDLERACKDHYNKRYWGMGFALGFRVLALSPEFRRLSTENIVPSYRRSKRRAIFLDYDGTLVSQNAISKALATNAIAVLNSLCNDPKNTVFVVSGRGWDALSGWLSECENLGIAAEHGYFLRWKKTSDWETNPLNADFNWKKIAEPVMELYTETTDGSYVEAKESALVWHYQDADRDFGPLQAIELLDHLENVLANEPVIVKKGQHIVEVKPQGVSKGLVAEKVLSKLIGNEESPDFVLCIGDDRSDEDMFESISNKVSRSLLPLSTEVFACTVGQKPSKARYYLESTKHVLTLLECLATNSSVRSKHTSEFRVSFESSP